jgi:2-oxoglutarate ferredoxin oxidoreductase subunit beta
VGFSVVEIISHCHTQYGRMNRMGSAVEMMEWQRDHAVTMEKAAQMKEEDLKGKFRIGVLIDRDLPPYQDEYERVRRWSKGVGGE